MNYVHGADAVGASVKTLRERYVELLRLRLAVLNAMLERVS